MPKRGCPYAEVIGDPIAHSKSPLIHGFWLEALGIDGGYRAKETGRKTLASYLESRRQDRDWRGCNLTSPLKVEALDFVDYVSLESFGIGAINCIVSRNGRLVGYNTDVDGIAEALDSTPLSGATATIIGAGGAARAALRHLTFRDAGLVRILTRNPVKAAGLPREARSRTPIDILPFEQSEQAMDGAVAIINASPLGMGHAGPMPQAVLGSLSRAAPEATAFDMVYDPPVTAFLEAAASAGLGTADGLTMLIGQARKAFALFFGVPPPPDRDAELRGLLS